MKAEAYGARKNLVHELEVRKNASLKRVLHTPGTDFSRPKPPEYLQIVNIGVPNPAPYVYEPMRGHVPGRAG